MCNAVRTLLKRACLAALLALTMLIPRTMAYAADTSGAALALPNVVAKAGDTVNLDLTISDNPGIVGMTVEINYDSRLTLTNISNGEAFKVLEMTKPGALEPGCRIHWDAVDLADEDIKDGVIATLTFTLSENVPAGSSCFVRVAGVSENGQMDVYDAELQTVELKAAAGTVSTEPEEQPQPVSVTGVALDQSSLTFTESGQTHQLHAQIAPKNADNTSVAWSTSNSDVATVSTSGLVTAIADGRATITVTTQDGAFTATCVVDVTIPESVVPVTGLNLDYPTLNLSSIGASAQLVATVEPSDATDSSVRWATSDESIATVSDDGLVTAVAEGVATIMVSSVDGGYMKACVVTVAVPKPVVSLKDAVISIERESYIYTGLAQTPAVVVTLAGEELLQDIDYTLAYENNIEVGQALITITGKGRYEGSRSSTFSIVPKPVGELAIVSPKPQIYTGKALTPAVDVRLGKKALVAGTDYTLTYTNNVKAGTATVVVEGKGSYTGSVSCKFTIAKADNPITAKGKKAKVKLSAVKKKAKTLAVSKVAKIAKAEGTKRYKVTKWTTAKAKKYIKVNAKTGKVTVKKGTPKGTYKFKLRVKAAGNANYKAGVKTVKVKVVVK